MPLLSHLEEQQCSPLPGIQCARGRPTVIRTQGTRRFATVAKKGGASQQQPSFISQPLAVDNPTRHSPSVSSQHPRSLD